MAVAVPLLLLGATACDSLGPAGEPVSVSFTGKAPATSLQGGIAASITVTSGENTLVIDKAQVVVRRIKLKRVAEDICADDDSTGTSSSDDDSCEELKLGPILVDLPLTDGTLTTISAMVPRDSYRKIEFKIHKLGDGTPEELALAAAHPEVDRVSIHVQGTYNGTPFVFTSELDEERELEFETPVVIDAGNENVTIQFDVASWFRNGSAVIDPATANKDGANEELVKNNIRASIRAFGDDDRDGR